MAFDSANPTESQPPHMINSKEPQPPHMIHVDPPPAGDKPTHGSSASSNGGGDKPSKGSSAGSQRKQVQTRKIHSMNDVTEVDAEADAEATAVLQKVAFEDHRWQQATSHIATNQHWSDNGHLHALLLQGAKAFGFWQLDQSILEVLAVHLRPIDPATLFKQMDRNGDGVLTQDEFQAVSLPKQQADACPTMKTWAKDVAAAMPTDTLASSYASRRQHVSAEEVGGLAKRAKPIDKTLQKNLPFFVWFGVVFIGCVWYALDVCFAKYPAILDVFKFPIFFARATGFGALLWTAGLFLTMSRTALKYLGRIMPCKLGRRMIDDHKEMHIFCAHMMLTFAGIHVCSHMIGTVPGLISRDLDEINDMLGCANPDTTKGYLGVQIPWLEWPECPLTSTPTYMQVIFASTPGLSGVLIVCCAVTIFMTANQKARKANFERFIFTHYAIFPFWIVLLFIHGSNGWVGVGFPLVVFICAIPVSLYACDRILRLLRYYLFAGRAVHIVDVVIRPGPKHAAKGSLVNLRISKPPYLWNFEDGMYAFLNMPEYAPGQWHPFTICSGKGDDTVDFIINGVGDWTCELSKRCLDSYDSNKDLPKIAMDGPYLAPTVTAKYQRVFIAVGAGVGITPFLSMMSAISGVLTDKKARRLPLEEAHFYWMTRSADEFLFGRKHFTKIMSNSKLRGKMFIHLHVTQKEPEKDVAAYMFREAVRKQSRLDRELFERTAKNFEVPNMIAGGPQTPWAWLNNARDDLLWVKALIDRDGEKDDVNALTTQDHWARGIRNKSSEQCDEDQGLGFRGLFSIRKSLSHDRVVIKGESGYMPISFGRPDFAKEIYSIGCARPDDNIHVYVCGNDMIVQSLQTVCAQCTEAAAEKARKTGARPQEYEVHFERFG